MAKWLSEEWFAQAVRLAADQPLRPGASARMQFVLTGGPQGKTTYYWVVEDGRLVRAGPGELDDAEVTLTQTWEDAEAIHRGELDAAAAFMQGRTKVSGEMGRLLAVLAASSSPEHRAWQKKLAATL